MEEHFQTGVISWAIRNVY